MIRAHEWLDTSREVKTTSKAGLRGQMRQLKASVDGKAGRELRCLAGAEALT